MFSSFFKRDDYYLLFFCFSWTISCRWIIDFDVLLNTFVFSSLSLSLSLSSNQIPSFFRFASESHHEASLEKLRSVSVSVEENAPLDFYQMIHIQSLMDVVKQMTCSSCHQMWDGSISVKKKEGKKSSLVFRMISFCS